jgi:transcriptional regulator with XRE-family HTH domain
MLLTSLQYCTYSAAMDELLGAADIERMARAEGIPISEVCRRADIAQSTFSRWKNGKTRPRIDVYWRLCAAVKQEVPDRAATTPLVAA